MQSVTIGPNQAGQRLDKFLRKLLPQAGTGFLYKMLRKKNITLNGKKAEGSESLALGDLVCFYFSEETFAKFAGRPYEILQEGYEPSTADMSEQYRRAYETLQGIQVIYQDDHILILDKPAGILTQKAQPEDISLNEWMIGYLLEHENGFERELESFRPSVCNRLDRNTSGLVLCGKSLPGLQYLSRCIRDRSIRKFYRTICTGQLLQEAGVMGYLIKDREQNRVRVIPKTDGIEAQGSKDNTSNRSKRTAPGDYIETAYRPLKTGKQYTLLEVELITGKPHQIRAHLASIGHPLIGDFKYGDRRINQRLQSEYNLQHHLLHAYQVIFPETKEPAGAGLSGKCISVSCPEIFERMQKELGLL